MSHFSSLQDARAYFSRDYFAMDNKMTLQALTEDGAVCAMQVTERHQNAEGGLMGGAILALADFTFAAAANNAHHPTVAQQVSLNFLNPALGNVLYANARCRRNGRASAFQWAGSRCVSRRFCRRGSRRPQRSQWWGW